MYYYAHGMDIRELVLEALHTLEVDQAGLAKRLGRSQATVSRWVSGDATPDYESCLRLARIVGMPARRVLEAARLDTTLVPEDRPDTQPKLRSRRVTKHDEGFDKPKNYERPQLSAWLRNASEHSEARRVAAQVGPNHFP